jgi:hypothetical protein
MGPKRWRFRPVLVLCIALACAAAVYVAVDRLTREKPYSSIEDRLYVGEFTNRPPPGTGAVVNLCERPDSYAVDACLWVPIDGSEAPDLEWLRRVVAFIDAQRRAGVTTYVHCLAGMNRSGMVVTAYLMHEHHWTREQALAFVRSRRPQVQPNPALMRLLGEWEEALKVQVDPSPRPR